MSWEKTTIGVHCTVTSSKRFHLSDRSQEGVPFYCSKEIIQKVNGQDVVECDYIKEEFYESVKERFGVPCAGDLLITSRGTYGIPYIYRENDRFYFADGNLTWLKDFDNGLSAKYLYYWILSHEGQKKIDAIAKGIAQKALPIASIRDIELTIPSIELQKKIATILSTYDDLIENNQMQIKLLEEAAQRLYKEWFVDLRFPGHENTPIIDGVPQGWENGILDDIVYESGKNEKKENREKYLYYLPIDCLPKQSIGYTEISDVCLAESSLVAFSKNDIIFGAMRPYFHKVVVARDSGLTRSTCFVLNARKIEFWAYVAMMMFSKNTVDYATQISVGTTMPYARWKDLKQMPIIIPTTKLAEEFQKNIKPIIDKIEVLSKAIMALKEARDCLLPQLMSGELEV